jgi:hypothetical protein
LQPVAAGGPSEGIEIMNGHRRLLLLAGCQAANGAAPGLIPARLRKTFLRIRRE